MDKKGWEFMDNDTTSLMTVDEVCEALMIGKNAAYRLLAEGKIKSFRVGRIWKIPRGSLNRYIREQCGIV